MRALPQETKEMQGTFEASREGFDPVSYDAFEKAPNVPTEWPIEAQTIWRDVWAVMKSGNYMSKGFVMMVRALCWAVYRRQIAEEKLLKFPADKDWEKIMDTNTKTVERICTKFGFSPVDMYKVPVIKRDKQNGYTGLE
jgi:hypothetical protein